MKPNRFTVAAALIAAMFVMFAGAAEASGWPGVRDRTMTLREHGRFQEAYALAVSHRATAAATLHDREFVAGWIALRFMRRADLAFNHFREMASHAPGLRPHERDAGRAKAGYWLGRALRELGRSRDSATMFTAAAAYPATFYGQLASAEIGRPITRDALGSRASEYPVRDFYWHDSRVDRSFVLGIIKQESRFRQSAVSPRNAIGMMQVLDSTARQVGREAGVDVNTGLMRNNADYNVAVGSRYLADQLDRYGGNPMLAAAAYNAGPARADEWLRRFGDPRGNRTDAVDWAESIPFRETRDYVQKVISNYMVYRALGN